MANKLPTYEDIKNEMMDELRKIEGVTINISSFSSDPMESHHQIKVTVVSFVGKMVERAGRQFDAMMEDKKRQLELGELADKFFQRIKIND